MMYCITVKELILLCISAQGMILKNMFFEVGQTLTLVGTAKPDATK